jgi:hypothetical protein
MSKVMKLMADYQCFPLWEYRDGELTGNVNPDDLPLTRELKSALHAWSASYDRTLNQEYPPDSGFASPAEEEAFETEGKRLWKELQAQLGPEYQVSYYSSQEARLLE